MVQVENLNLKFPAPSSEIEGWQNELVDDVPVRGTRLLFDIYDKCNIAVCEPKNYEEAKKNQVWVATMKWELSMIEKNQTWHLVERPQDKNVIGVKWVYITKLNADGSINKHMIRYLILVPLLMKKYSLNFSASKRLVLGFLLGILSWVHPKCVNP